MIQSAQLTTRHRCVHVTFLDGCPQPIKRNKYFFLTDSAPVPDLYCFASFHSFTYVHCELLQNNLHVFFPNSLYKRVLSIRRLSSPSSPAAAGLDCTPQDLAFFLASIWLNKPLSSRSTFSLKSFCLTIGLYIQFNTYNYIHIKQKSHLSFYY